MWPLEEYRFDRQVLEKLRARGFELRELDSGRVEVRKQDVVVVFEQDADAKFRLTEPPGYLVRGQFAHLWDAGYQKFWLLESPHTASGAVNPEQRARVPALAAELKQLHAVSEELRSLLGIPSFYNESLGTTCHVTAYDRLRGRPG